MFKTAKTLGFLFGLDLVALIILRGWYFMLKHSLTYMGVSEIGQKFIISAIFVVIGSIAMGFLCHEVKIAPIENEDDTTESEK